MPLHPPGGNYMKKQDLNTKSETQFPQNVYED